MIIVPGSINADLLFPVVKLPAPGETVLCPDYSMAPGGKGSNQATAAAKAGAQVRFIGHVGDDAYGPVVKQMIADAGVDVTGLVTSPKPTAIAVIGVDRAGENQIIVASGANLDTGPDQLDPSILGPGITVLCQNEIRTEATFAMLRLAAAAGARTILNLAPAAPVPDDVFEVLDVLVVNELEAEAAAGGTGRPEDLATGLARRFDMAVVVTLGGEGAIAATRDAAWRIGAMRIDPVDTTGAGDAFTGILAACLDRGLDLPASLHHAAVGAALACEKLGAQSAQPMLAAIEARLGELAPPASASW